ncbi:PQQ-dependent sugar dehydrogenase [Nibrella saemangeumensis]|uniref:PQQ-dependent sugar dehydrogenase n=2 Tax=Nibrella saemangeumensis TaxID=1084526 RepID=A0ABP8MX95_9BACT
MLGKAISTLCFSMAATAGFSFLVSMACQPAEKEATVVQSGSAAVQVVNAYPNLSFSQPVEYTHANDGSNRVFVVEQAGRIRVFDNTESAQSAGTYLDIRSKVASGGEMGLLGLAFHPNFRQNGYFYVNYTKSNPRETVISRFKASSANASQVDAGSEVVLLTFPQPYSNHNGGKILFGPDGHLYIATGDGGSGGDPQNNGQTRNTLLGKILRIDVNSTEKGNYGIPADNPFKGNRDGVREEIYAYGLRNPWRISFDNQGRLWAGDVGQNELEEIDIIEKGGNYGWRLTEGRDCYNPKNNCDQGNLVGPVWQYPHENGNVSVTGGVVYRGKAQPDLQNKYIYADYASGRVWALTYNGTKATDNQVLVNRAGTISAFGEDANGEMYLLDHGSGRVLKLASTR